MKLAEEGSFNIVVKVRLSIDASDRSAPKMSLENFLVSFPFQVEYVIYVDVNGQSLEFGCCAEEELVVPVIQPFSFEVRTLSEKVRSCKCRATGRVLRRS